MVDLAGSDGGSGDQFARYYYGYSGAAALVWSSLTWAGIHTVAALTNAREVGIVRTDSSFAIATRGVYVFDLRAVAYNTSGNDTIAFRARLAGATLAVQQIYSEGATSRMASAHLNFAAPINAGEVVSLEYAVAPAAYSSFGPITVDGEAARGFAVSIYRIGSF
jgi:hypothetical protein